MLLNKTLTNKLISSISLKAVTSTLSKPLSTSNNDTKVIIIIIAFIIKVDLLICYVTTKLKYKA
jgi:hypothetical protein